ncbi:nucleoporin NUP159-like [Lycium barbarum]|uniref:nucleoporin NUP159-like n=1 Tax=Lycium barbarum TaxID=112863 RepID=UPI00293E0C31|nr:nucleoporin NUP159-like [Lycium barbarum]
MGNPRQAKKASPKVAGKGKGHGAGKVTSRLRNEDQIKDTRATKKPVAPSRPASPSESSSSSDEESSSSSSSHSESRQAVTPAHRPQPPIRQPTAEERKKECEQEWRETDIRMRAMYEQGNNGLPSIQADLAQVKADIQGLKIPEMEPSAPILPLDPSLFSTEPTKPLDDELTEGKEENEKEEEKENEEEENEGEESEEVPEVESEGDLASET